ncbi:MAG: biotin-dependent carboxyltransferase family protein [Synergistaceae bacterium]|jgi:biotin-dependent carboxylase-like uncharacterized protein|nr:biotin-dependent carboxyltransferase family protein [Synergistaceae bacterium]
MSFLVEKPGMLTIVQDLGRWGHQLRGVTVSAPMDQFSLRIGNVMLGNGENDAALETTLLGLRIVMREERCVVLAGADLCMTIDGSPAAAWLVHRVAPGSRISIGGPSGDGVRSYLCFSGGIDVPVVMGSRSTYTRASLGGFGGRALKSGDVVYTCDPKPLWRRAEGFSCPPEFRPTRHRGDPLEALDGPQADAFTERGIATFYGERYTVTNEADRMGYRLDGPEIERCKSPDIVSDGIAPGAVQVPGHGRPIVMMSDRQTTGGYTKIAVVGTWSAAQLAQRMPGETVRFRRVTEREATARLQKFEDDLSALDALRATYRSRGKF